LTPKGGKGKGECRVAFRRKGKLLERMGDKQEKLKNKVIIPEKEGEEKCYTTTEKKEKDKNRTR